MKKYKIIVYAISKNEEKHVQRWYESMKEADEIVVLDTGSTDNTINLLKECPKVKVYQEKIEPWRFDVARNKSLEYVDKKADICVCTDLDECFDRGWRKLLEKNWQKDTTRASYLYHWNFDENGNPGTTFYLNKIHKRIGYKWTHPVHEVLTNEIEEKQILIPGMTLNHYADNTKSRSSYLPLLELSLKESPNDDRNAHYLGREYMFYQEWDKAIETLHYHLKLPSATWKDERSASMRFISRCYHQKNYLEEAIMWAENAIKEAPYLRESYTELGYLYYNEKEYKLAIKYLLNALNITDKSQSYINEENAWNETIYNILSVCYFYIGDYENSLKYCEIALNTNPNNEEIKNNYQIIKEKNKE